jgi:hypothetical protein
METIFSTVTSISVGLGLAASCGFRVFVPMLMMSIAVKAGLLELSSGWDWIGSWPALIAFIVATVVEIGGFYVPWLDNLLDTIAAPSAVVAGTVTTAACVADLSPFLQWSTAIIAGGGLAASIKGFTILARGGSTAATAGIGNPLVATFELLMSFVLSVLALVVPLLAAVAVGLIGFVIVKRTLVYRAARRARTQPQT